MKRYIIITMVFFAAAGMVFSQQAVGDPDPYVLGIDSAQQQLKEVSVDKFEYDGFWSSSMPKDEGYTASRLFVGGPSGKEPIPDEEGMDIPDQHVLGVKVDFLRRGYNTITLKPLRPIPIEGITKTVSVWVVGRNFNHSLYLLIRDNFGRNYEIYMGKMNFQGWKKLTVAIPPQTSGGVNGVNQRSYHYNYHAGINITGFRINCDPMEAYGNYYIYFDDLRAVTDLFAENNRDPDDMADGW